MAATSQVNCTVRIWMFVVCSLCCVFVTESLNIDIPSDARAGYYVTKLGCLQPEIELKVNNEKRFKEFFRVTIAGDLVVKRDIPEQTKERFELTVSRKYSACSLNIPLKERKISLTIKEYNQIRPLTKSLYTVFLSESKKTLITDESLHDFTLELSGNSAKHFKLEFGENGLEVTKLTRNQLPYSELHFTIMVKNKDGAPVCSSHLKVHMMDRRRKGKITSDMTGARKRLVPMTIRTRDNILRSETDHQWSPVMFNQDDHVGDKTILTPNVQPLNSARRKRSLVRRLKRSIEVKADVQESQTGILYSITSGGGNVATTFRLVSSTPEGIVTVSTDGKVNLAQGKTLNYDAGLKTIEVRANEVSNDGIVRHEHIVTLNILDVNDENPEFTNEPSPFLAKVDSYAKVGTSVYQLSAKDPDTGSKVEFKLEGNSNFFEVSTSGLVSTKTALTQSTTEEIRVSVSDVAANPVQKSATKTLSITTLDRAPQFYRTVYYCSVSENNKVGDKCVFEDDKGTEVELKVINFQSPATTTFTVINPNSKMPSRLFSIVTDGGKRQVEAKQVFDNEVKPQYILKLRAEDSYSGLYTEVDLTIKIEDRNEFDPWFPRAVYLFSDIREDSAVGTTVNPQDPVSAVDEDKHSILSYKLEDIDSAAPNSGNFSIDSKGFITVNGKLDYDDTPGKRYSFRVVVTDDGGITKQPKSASTTVMVGMKNVNDIAPEFMHNSYSQTVQDDAISYQPVVLKVKAFDRDGDGIQYKLEGPGTTETTAANNLFKLDNSTGLITLTGQSIPKDISTYQFKVLAVDTGTKCCDSTPSSYHTATASITLNIVDALNTKPEFPQSCNGKTVEVLENEPKGTKVGPQPTSATDKSRGQYGIVTYSIRRDFRFNALNYFEINSQTGQVTTTRELSLQDLNLRYKTITITVKATDQGNPPLSDLCTFRVKIVDVNDHAPSMSSSFNHTVVASTAVNTDIFIIRATDQDEGSNSAITYSFQQANEYFKIDPAIGKITLIKALNIAGAPRTISSVVVATDGGSLPKSSTATFVLTVRESTSNNVPYWNQSIYEREIKETDGIGTSITLESSNAVEVTITNLAVDESDYFRFDPKNNKISIILKKPLDYVKKRVHNILLRVSNKDVPPLNAYCIVRISVIQQNVQSPVVYGIPYESANNYIKLSVLENIQSSSGVGFVVAYDQDVKEAFHKVNYTITTTPNPGFSVNANTGAITTTKEFDAEAAQSSYFINILAQDGAKSDFPNVDGPNSVNQGVLIEISDANDNEPQLTQTTFTFNVNEGAAISSKVGRVTATDRDKSQIFYFTLESKVPNEEFPFSIEWSSGDIIVTNYLDYETKKSYNLQVRVFDGKYNSTGSVVITVLDVNDVPPEFPTAQYIFRGLVTENVDYASNPKTIKTYALKVTVFDGKYNGSGTVNINVQDVNDITPVFSEPTYTFTNCTENVDYSSQNFQLGMLDASDTDSSPPFTYSIVSSKADITSNFELGATTGVLKVKGTLDRERVGGDYQFTVTVVDTQTAPSLTGYTTVKVIPQDANDNSPVFDPDSLIGSVSENSAVDISVLKVIATDKDSGINGEISYSINSGSQTPSSAFKIAQQSGIVQTSVNTIDRETVAQFTMTVKAQDGATGAAKRSSEATATIIVIDVNDNAPKFNKTSFSIKIYENNTKHPDILEIHAYDLDANSILTYSVRTGDFKYFNVQKRGTAFLQVHNAIDYDAGERNFTVVVTVSDGKFTDTCTIEITVLDINDNAPVFTSLDVLNNGSFKEDVAVDTTVASFTANDIDSGINKQFDFFILLESDPKKYFKVVTNSDGVSGQVKTRKSLDREDIPEFSLKLLAIDRGTPQLTGTAVINITLEDVNDSPPVLSTNTIQIEEGENPKFIKTLTAKDPDTAQFGPPFKFTLPVCGNAQPSVCNKFEFTRGSTLSDGSDTLRVSSLVKLDREDNSRYLVPIIIADTGSVSSSQTGTSTLTIEVLDMNDNPQTDADQSVDVYNYKNMFHDVDIGLVGFEDPDGDDRSTKKFRKLSDYTDRYFQVNPETGTIRLLKNVPVGSHKFYVSVVDNAIMIANQQITKTSTTTVNVFIENMPEEAPYKSGSTRVCGTTAKKFVTKTNGKSPYDRWRELLANALNYDTVNNVQIINVIDKRVDDKDCIDIRYAAHGSPYYNPTVLDAIVMKDKTKFQTAAGADIVAVNIDECLKEYTCEGGCYNQLTVPGTPNVVNTNTATVVGVTTVLKPVCGCRAPVSQTECSNDYCYNGGTCMKDLWGVLSCNCSTANNGEGPRCQRLTQGFDGSGQGMFKPLEQCSNWETSIEFATEKENALIMYQGPSRVMTDEEPTDFLALQLKQGYPELLVNLGTGVLSLTLDGKDAIGAVKLNKLSDNKWHKITIIKREKLITMEVDDCKTAVSPDGGATADRKSCEASGYTPSTHKYLNTNSPLQLGGRYAPNITPPTNIIATRFIGCMRNLRHKGELYDLHTAGIQTGVLDKCEAQEKACDTVNCGDNGICKLTEGASLSNPTTECDCDIGYRGPTCQFATTMMEIQEKSFIDWRLASTAFLNDKETSFKLSYRTRDENGLLFHLSSTSSSEFIRLQITNSNLELKYNIGDPKTASLVMSGVSASDGQWHTVVVKRVVRNWIMTLDGGEGPRYVTSLGEAGGHGEIALSSQGLYAGAEVSYTSGSAVYDQSNSDSTDLTKSCYNDVRLEKKWFPMTLSENTDNSFVKYVRAQNAAQSNCQPNDCASVTCPGGQECIPLWYKHICRCPLGKEIINNICVAIDYCKNSPCATGATCRSLTTDFVCDCPAGWEGRYCNQRGQTATTTAAPGDDTAGALIGGIVGGLIVLIILILLIGFLLWTRCRPTDDQDNLVFEDKDDYEIRENVVAYDEEGAGEEDNAAYDLNRLRKPMDTMTRMDKPIFDAENERPVKSGFPGGPGIGDFIGDRLDDANDDPNAPPYDTVLDLNYEGGGSDAGSLSSLNTSSTGGEQDYNYLNNWGPKFARLAEMYNQGEESD